MKIGQAIEDMLAGFHAWRKGWNGKGIHLYIVKDAQRMDSLTNSNIAPFIAIDTRSLETDNGYAAKVLIPWLASQTDILADDWESDRPIDCGDDVCLYFNEYQEKAFTTALPASKNTSYMALGLAGEAGEVANKAKKIIRDGKEFDREDLTKELGDILWYVAGLATINNISLGEVAEKNIEKLFDRKARGAIQGSGDNR